MEEEPHPIDVLVGQRMRQQRKRLGLILAALADALGLTHQQVQKYERGINRISASKLFEAARVLDVPIAYFFDGSETVPAAAHRPSKEQASLSRELQMLTDAYRRLPNPRVRRRILDLVTTMAEASGCP